jgi:hypothetical protein
LIDIIKELDERVNEINYFAEGGEMSNEVLENEWK